MCLTSAGAGESLAAMSVVKANLAGGMAKLIDLSYFGNAGGWWGRSLRDVCGVWNHGSETTKRNTT